MGAPKYARFVVDFHEWFPQGLYLVGEITAVTEYQSQEDKARNRPVRPRVDEATGRPLFRGTFADPSAEKDREKSITVEFACAHQPVPPTAVAGLPFRPVILEGMTVASRAETSGQAKWITWTIRATGMTAPGATSAEGTTASRPTSGRSSADTPGRAAATHPRLPERRQPTDPSSRRRLSRPLGAAQTDPPRTLTEVHEALVRIRPARQAPLEQWLAHHQGSADLYAEIAEIDRAHHHEALYMAEHERDRAKEIEAQLATQQPSGSEQREGVGGGENRDGGSAEDLDAGS